ncbi:PLSCR1 isoform 15 [Pan troglodytes]|uniref:PLSCR1 isoform 10 n=1 Tax=Pan troglodytes TaxID=9598 RepID=A0A2J8P2Y6_PANTR|nr:PLSCR1 isoform 9 [Pan troglodytes]PNI78387.1 PLSCR1 isoform 10 [Pan troglodytes]PNI78388.1 PLSCR1 isoform 12 [Pan troglodytes]PNI78389.1 PLSCR1 isoform 13 [Pan troglodytes]PNI78390.1 PLSCR1 isoform 14 [Pan troglodytes]
MDKQNPQMNASHPETNLPVGYPPQYPPTAFQDRSDTDSSAN